MARRDLKNRTPLGSAIDTSLYHKLKQYSKESGVPVSKLLDKAIEQYLEVVKKR